MEEIKKETKKNNFEMKKNNKKESPREFRKTGIENEFEQKLLDLARVTRVMAGGKRMKFRACIALGNHKGIVGVGIDKGADVSIAISKAVTRAKKNLIKVKFDNDTIKFPLKTKFKAAKILLKPAPKGTGVKAGGPVRIIAELCGIPNVVGKILGSNNTINNAQATIEALKKLEKM